MVIRYYFLKMLYNTMYRTLTQTLILTSTGLFYVIGNKLFILRFYFKRIL